MPSDPTPLWQRYRHLLRPRTADEVSDELRFHLQMRADEARRAGLSEPEAQAAALERFGEYDPVEAELLRIDQARERRRGRLEWIGDIKQDAAFALRSIRRVPSFAVAAIATLAIAIGANTAIYSVVHAMLLTPLPYARPQQLVSLWGSSLGELMALRQQLRSVSDIATFAGADANVDDGSSAERLSGAMVTANFFSLLGVNARIGRVFLPGEDDPGATDIIILSEGLWRRTFGADSAVIGRRVLVDGAPTRVVGVMPKEFAFPDATVAFWRPVIIDRAQPARLWTSGGSNFIGRLRPGASVDAARTELKRVAVALRRSNLVWDPGPKYGSNADVQPLRDALVGDARLVLLLLSACASLVLVIACVNVANLLLARASSRERELAVRAALGGGRSRLVRQLLTESVVLSAGGALLGFGLATAGVRWLVAQLPLDTPRVSEISMNASALGFTAVIAVLTGIAFGVLPALRATRESPTSDVVRSGRTGYGAGHQRVTALLVVGEVALAVLVVIGAELLVRSFRELRQLDPGFRTTHIIATQLRPTPASYGAPGRADEFYTTVLARAAALPGVQAVAAVNRLPLWQQSFGIALRVEGQFEDATHLLPFANHLQIVTPSYFSMLGIPVRRGRAFSSDDRDGTQPVAIVSTALAAALWPNDDPIGKRVGYPYESPWITVVGVVPDVKSDSLRDTTGSAIYLPFLQRPRDVKGNARADYTIIASTSRDAPAIGRDLRSLIASIDRTVPVGEIQTLDHVVAQSVSKARFTMLLVGGFGVVALLLGAVGIYGVMSYVVSQRMQEMGVRTALGATANDLLRMVILRATVLAGTGAAIGVAAALIAVHPLRALLYGVSTADPVTYISVPLLFIAVALAASTGPARRAARVSPASVLRAD